jgi:hypothetical protein
MRLPHIEGTTPNMKRASPHVSRVNPFAAASLIRSSSFRSTIRRASWRDSISDLSPRCFHSSL